MDIIAFGRRFLGVSCLVVQLPACGSDDAHNRVDSPTGGSVATGGHVSTGGFATIGGSESTGGASTSGGASVVFSATGGSSTGAAGATGGAVQTGGFATTGGGPSTGGNSVTGGADTGGAATGGAANAGGTTSVSTGEGLCTADGWCWVEPRPQGHALLGMTEADSELWAVGEGGTIVHRRADGAFDTLLLPNLTTLNSASALSSNDVWAVGEGGFVAHFDGVSWQQQSTSTTLTLNAVKAFAANDVWAAGGVGQFSPGVILHYDGSAWNNVDTGLQTSRPIFDIAGPSSTDLWMVGYESGGYTVHRDANGWAYGGGSLEGYQAFTSIEAWQGAYYVSNDYGSGLLDVWRSGTWTTVSSNVHQRMFALAAATDRLWIAGETNVISYDGGAFQLALTFDATGQSTVHAGATGVWAAGQGSRLFQYDAGAFSLAYGSNWVGVGRYGAVYVRSNTDIWLLGYGTLHYDGVSWTRSTTPNISGYWANQNGIWIVADRSVQRWNGSTWETVTTFSSISTPTTIWGTSDTDIWVGGSSAMLVHYDGNSWTPLALPAYTTSEVIRSIDGTGSNDVWIAGDHKLYHWDGKGLQDRTPPDLGSDYLSKIDVFSENSVWLGTDGSVLHHWEGNTWHHWAAGGQGIHSIAAFSDTDVFVGIYKGVNRGAILHFDGAALTTQQSGCVYGIGNFFIQDQNTLWASGQGAILRWVRK